MTRGQPESRRGAEGTNPENEGRASTGRGEAWRAQSVKDTLSLESLKGPGKALQRVQTG